MPAWADRLKGRYLAGEASMFMLHGNTRDLCRWEGEGETPEYLALVPFLVEMFSRSKDIVLTYNVSQGVQFPDKQMKKRCLVAVNARRAIEGRRPSMLSRPHLRTSCR